jgi:hypothetical protein
MAIKRVRIDYTVYPPIHQSGGPCWDFRTFERARKAARVLGPGARVYRNFNQSNKEEDAVGDWWSGKRYWTWDGTSFSSAFDRQLPKDAASRNQAP